MKTTSAPSDADILIQKVCSDLGLHRTHRKCASNAPDVLVENAGINETAHISEVFTHSFDLSETHRRTADNTRSLLDYNKPVLSLGGDHSISFPVIKAVAKNHPDIKLVWIDSHLDFKKPVENYVSHDVVVRELVEQDIIPPENICFFGTSKIDHDEKIPNQSMIKKNTEEVKGFCKNSKTYVSVDVDVLESLTGTGYPDGETSVKQVKKVFRLADPSFCDLVEAAPALDNTGTTVEKTSDLLKFMASEIS